MRITESQLRRIIREEVRALRESVGGDTSPSDLTPNLPIDTAEGFAKLTRGNRITVDGAAATVDRYEAPILHYTPAVSRVAEELDVGYALSGDQDLGDGPLVQVAWIGPRSASQGDVYPRWLD